jgi:DnaK suppressor protein
MTCHVALRIGELEDRLRRDRREASHALVSTDAELAGLERPHRGEFFDDAAKETARRLLARLEERDRRVLAEIDAAEERLASGTFGVCEACAQPIPFPRLRALPMARLCITCEERAERAARRPRGVAGADDVTLGGTRR